MNRRILVFAAVAATALSCEFARANLLVQLPGLVTNGVTSSFSYAYGLSADGNSVVGVATTSSANALYVGVEWSFNSSTQSFAAPVNLGTLDASGPADSNYRAYANGVTRDGSLVVGSSRVSNSTLYAVSWSATSSPVTAINLGNPSGTTGEVHISEDGKALVADNTTNTTNPVGYYNVPGVTPGWIAMPIPTTVTNLTGYTVSSVSANDVSNLGAGSSLVITGNLKLTSTTGGKNAIQAFSYTPTAGYTALGSPLTYTGSIGSGAWNYGPLYTTPESADGRFVSGVGINPTSGKEDGYIYDSNNPSSVQWFNAAESGTTLNVAPTAVSDDGSFVVGLDFGTKDNGWIWSASTGFEPIATFLTSEGLNASALGGSTGPGAVYGVSINNDILTLTGLDKDYASNGGTSFYAQVSVPEPTSLLPLATSTVLLLARRRRSKSHVAV